MVRRAQRRRRRNQSSRYVKMSLSAEELARVEAAMRKVVAPWIWASRSDVLRMLLLTATEGAERDPRRFKARRRRRLAV
jgi:hypothetical protein